MADNDENDQKCYIPDSTLVKFMGRKLRIEKMKEEIHLSTEASPSDSFKKEIRKNDRMKSHILDKFIFPSMANLTFFFECIAEYPELQKTFEDDIKELLGIKRNNPVSKIYGFMFSKLIDCILSWDVIHIKDPIRGRKNFRVDLMNVLQIIVANHFEEKISELNVPNTINILARNDMDRTWGWINMLKNSIGDQDELALRKDVKEIKKTIKELREYNKNNLKDSSRISILIDKHQSDIENHDAYIEKMLPGRTFEWAIKDLLRVDS